MFYILFPFLARRSVIHETKGVSGGQLHIGWVHVDIPPIDRAKRRAGKQDKTKGNVKIEYLKKLLMLLRVMHFSKWSFSAVLRFHVVKSNLVLVTGLGPRDVLDDPSKPPKVKSAPASALRQQLFLLVRLGTKHDALPS